MYVRYIQVASPERTGSLRPGTTPYKRAEQRRTSTWALSETLWAPVPAANIIIPRTMLPSASLKLPPLISQVFSVPREIIRQDPTQPIARTRIGVLGHCRAAGRHGTWRCEPKSSRRAITLFDAPSTSSINTSTSRSVKCWSKAAVDLSDRLRMVVAARRGMIQAWDVDPREPWPDGRYCTQDQALPV